MNKLLLFRMIVLTLGLVATGASSEALPVIDSQDADDAELQELIETRERVPTPTELRRLAELSRRRQEQKDAAIREKARLLVERLEEADLPVERRGVFEELGRQEEACHLSLTTLSSWTKGAKLSADRIAAAKALHRLSRVERSHPARLLIQRTFTEGYLGETDRNVQELLLGLIARYVPSDYTTTFVGSLLKDEKVSQGDKKLLLQSIRIPSFMVQLDQWQELRDTLAAVLVAMPEGVVGDLIQEKLLQIDAVLAQELEQRSRVGLFRPVLEWFRVAGDRLRSDPSALAEARKMYVQDAPVELEGQRESMTEEEYLELKQMLEEIRFLLEGDEESARKLRNKD